MSQFHKKIIILFLVLGLNYSGLLAVGETLAYYFDNESAPENVLSAGTLDFSITPSDWNPVESEVSLELGNTAFREVGMQNDGILDFQYTVETDNKSGDAEFCSSLNLRAELLGVEMYNGSLTGFLSTATNAVDVWNYRIDMPTNYQNSVCNFDFLYNGWQLDMPSYGSGGFSDTEKVGNKIASWGLRINKVYYYVAGDRGVKGDNEWVEIYNQTNVPLDISGWEICDNTSCDVIPSSSPIPPEGFGVITASSTTWGYWEIPSDVVKIVLNSDIGDGLSNTDDRVILKRPDGIEIDAMSYGGDTYAFDPSCLGVAEGNILGRNPNGHDTNQASDFIEFGPPIVDLIYPDQSGTLMWYWYHNYDIQWTAVNPNGDGEELSIDLYYIKDVNHDKIISSGDTTHTIVKNTANDDFYTWQVPGGFIGYIWVKIVAKGPENPMLNDSMTSGKIFDPFPDELWETNPELILAALAEYEASAGDPLPEEFLAALDFGLATADEPVAEIENPVEDPAAPEDITGETEEENTEPEEAAESAQPGLPQNTDDEVPIASGIEEEPVLGLEEETGPEESLPPADVEEPMIVEQEPVQEEGPEQLQAEEAEIEEDTTKEEPPAPSPVDAPAPAE